MGRNAGSNHNGMALLVESICRLVSVAAVPDVLALVLGRIPDEWLAGFISGILLETLFRRLGWRTVVAMTLKQMTTKQEARARGRGAMFDEAADHLDTDVTNDPKERAEIPYVQRELRKLANKWWKEGEI